MSKKIVISIGHGTSIHGGYDPGALSKDGRYEEHKIAAVIGKYAAEYLGCKLINYDGSMSLTDRIKEINRLNPDFCADIHLNAGGGKGTEAFYYHNSPTGKRAATEVCREISAALDVNNRCAKIKLNKYGKDYFAYIRCTRPCAILIETVFIDNDSDLEKINTPESMQKCGYAIGRALEKSIIKYQ